MDKYIFIKNADVGFYNASFKKFKIGDIVNGIEDEFGYISIYENERLV